MTKFGLICGLMKTSLVPTAHPHKQKNRLVPLSGRTGKENGLLSFVLYLVSLERVHIYPSFL